MQLYVSICNVMQLYFIPTDDETWYSLIGLIHLGLHPLNGSPFHPGWYWQIDPPDGVGVHVAPEPHEDVLQAVST